MNRNNSTPSMCSIIVLLLIIICSSSIYAQDEFDFNEVEENKNISLPISGTISFETARQISNDNRWILMGPSLNWKINYNSSLGQLYFEGIERFNLSYMIENDLEKTIDDYQFEFIFRELFWKKAFSNFTLSIGKVIDIRGVNDFFQIVDKVSVLNRTNYFFAEPKEVKLGQNIIKLEYFNNDYELGFIFIPYPSFDRVTDENHPYALVKDHKLFTNDSERKMEGSVYYNKYFDKGMFSLIGGKFNNRLPILEAQILNGQTNISFSKIYNPYWTIAGAFNLAYEPLLLKLETSFNFEKPFQTIIQNLPTGYKKMNELEFAFGIDYNIGNSGMITAEILSQIPFQKSNSLAINRIVFNAALGYSGSFINDKLKINVLTMVLESLGNIINRVQLNYYFTNQFSVGVKYTSFNINQYKNTYGYLENYNRIDLTFSYDFNLE